MELPHPELVLVDVEDIGVDGSAGAKFAVDVPFTRAVYEIHNHNG